MKLEMWNEQGIRGNDIFLGARPYCHWHSCGHGKMRLAERQKLAAEHAKAIMPPVIYEALVAAMASSAAVGFLYTNRLGIKKEYWNEYPHSFFETPEVFEEAVIPLAVPFAAPIFELPVAPKVRIEERLLSAAEQAKAIIPPSLYAITTAAIAAGAAINFVYTDEFGVKKMYLNEYPYSFFIGAADSLWPGSVLLWSRQSGTTLYKQYRVERISGVQMIITLMEALMDPSGKADFWSGKTQTILEVI